MERNRAVERVPTISAVVITAFTLEPRLSPSLLEWSEAKAFPKQMPALVDVQLVIPVPTLIRILPSISGRLLRVAARGAFHQKRTGIRHAERNCEHGVTKSRVGEIPDTMSNRLGRRIVTATSPGDSAIASKG
jgi:hypothetical protein